MRELVSDKPYFEMTDDELRKQLEIWKGHSDQAAGWPSAYFAAKQLEAIVSISNSRRLGFVNPYPIKVG